MYTMYTGGAKNEEVRVETIKTTEETKKALEELATEKEWSLSQLCNKILNEYTKKDADAK